MDTVTRVLGQLERLVTFFLPSCTTANQQIKSRVLISLCLLVSLISVLVSLYICLFSSATAANKLFSALLTLTLSGACVYSLYQLRYHNNYRLAAQVLVVTTFLALSVTTVSFGGVLYRSSSSLLIVAPLFAFVLLDYRAGLLFSLLNYALFIMVAGLEINGVPIPNLDAADHTPASQLIITHAAFITVLGVIAFYEYRIGHYANHLSNLAETDELTQLPNRRVFMQRCAKQIELGKPFVLLYLDVDEFKPINDRYGHNTGDEVLTEVARRLKQGLRSGDLAFRLGGDEFAALMLPRCQNPEPKAIQHNIQRINSSILEPISSGIHSCSVGCSIGFARYPQDGNSIEQLMHKADTAMYNDKMEKRYKRHTQKSRLEAGSIQNLKKGA